MSLQQRQPTDHEDRQKFRNQEYWDKRFAEESADPESSSHHEWFTDYSTFQHLVTSICSPARSPTSTNDILVLGCGNSSLSADLLNDYPHATITSSDYSPAVIEYMKNKHKHVSNLKWTVSDIRDIPCANTYDMVIEKGVLDALVAGSRSPWPEDMDTQCLEDVGNAVKSIAKVVRHGKRFVSISFAHPMLRRELLSGSFGVRVHSFISPMTGFEYYLYECSLDLTETDQELYEYGTGGEFTGDVELPETNIANITDDIFL